MSTTQAKRRSTLISVLLTFFVDNLSWAIVFPIFAPYFLDPDNVLFSPERSAATRTMVFGFFVMAFSLGQFLGAPILGEYADRNGRKKALGLAVFFTLIGLSVSAWSMGIHNLYLLFAGRLFTGIFASSTTVCLACISDLSEDEASKVKNFGYLSVTGGLSFVLGAFLGGKLSDSSLNSSFSANFPLWIAAGLCFGNFLFILFGFRETSKTTKMAKFDFFKSFRNIRIALKMDKIKGVYTIYFLFLFAWTILFQFITILVVNQFLFTNSDIGDLALYMGICWAIGSGYINKFLADRFNPIRILEVCLIGFTILCALIILPSQIPLFLILVGLCVIFGGLAWPLCAHLISSLAPREFQGKVLGVSQSIQSLAMTMAPLVGGLVVNVSLSFPFLIAAAANFIAVALYFFLLKDR